MFLFCILQTENVVLTFFFYFNLYFFKLLLVYI